VVGKVEVYTDNRF